MITNLNKYRSTYTGTIIPREQTETLFRVFGAKTVYEMVKKGILIPCGYWPNIVEKRSWQELCDYGLKTEAVRKLVEDSGSSIRDAYETVNAYMEALKEQYRRK